MFMAHNKFIAILSLPLFFTFTAATGITGNSHLWPITDGIADDNLTTHNIQTYIVFVEETESSELLSNEDLEAWHRSFLPNDTLVSGEPRLVYSYREAISGFAAKLTSDEVQVMGTMQGFLGVEPDKPARLHTTYTPEFLHLDGGMLHEDSLWADSEMGAGIIIGVIDSGFVPTHASFSDSGMPAPPTKWKVTECAYDKFKCNNKIISAKSFGTQYADGGRGHGTHVASIAAGNFVADAHALNMAKGRASGMAPLAHLALYKKTSGSTTVKAIDEAILDGVDIISMSQGFGYYHLHSVPVVVATFSAISKGIFFCASAGNDGPSASEIENDAPWIMTVGAGTTDRLIKATVRLEDGTEFVGQSGNQTASLSSSMLPMIYPQDENFRFGICGVPFGSSIDAKGKIVICHGEGVFKGRNVVKSGGAAMIILTESETTSPESHVLPAADLDRKDGEALVKRYRQAKSQNQTLYGTITFQGTVFENNPAPKVAYFSSRGPSMYNGGILKPDIFAPGQDILAAWPTSDHGFDFQSGTSMSTPHVSGIAALIMKIHPQWSPATIQSALMTTATRLASDQKEILDANDNSKASVFATGAGHANPVDARNPGLIYELRKSDYISYLCGLHYTDDQVTKFTKKRTSCSDIQAIEPEQLNYPSISVVMGRNSAKTVSRKLTNIADSGSTYTFEIHGLEGLTVEISPERLEFAKHKDTASFNVTFSIQWQPRSLQAADQYVEGWLALTDRKHYVSTPIVVTLV